PGLPPGPVLDLGLGEAGEAPGAVLDADAAPLEAAEGLVRPERDVRVHPDGAAVEAFGDGPGPVDVRRPDGARQAVHGGVGAGDDLVDVAVGDDGQRRAELLLVDDAGALGGAGEDRRLEEVAGPVDRAAAGGRLRAARERLGDETGHPLELGAV